jgi:hypothetical protein
MEFLTHHLPALRFDWAAINTTLVLAALVAVTLLLLAQLRRVGSQSARDLQRVFEQLDLMRLDAQELLARAPTVLPLASAPRGAAAAAPGAAEIVNYRTAARLAECGTSMREIAERCGLVSGEARVLVALQQARARRAVNA